MTIDSLDSIYDDGYSVNDLLGSLFAFFVEMFSFFDNFFKKYIKTTTTTDAG